jgi:tRNA(fMet)-specific endonuclease VapC
MFLLDTDHMSIIQRQTQPEYGRLDQRLNQHPSNVIFTSVVSFHEQMLGANAFISQARSPAGILRGYEILLQILTDFAASQVLPFDQSAQQVFDTLPARSLRVATMDLRIAATALARGMTVLTRNVRDFGRVPGLSVDDWTV